MRLLKTLLPVFLVVGLSYWAIQPLVQSGFFPMHDDTQVARVFALHQALVDGAFPVRWIGGLGYDYGYPLFNFYAPLAYYVGGVLEFFTDALTATKWMMLIGVVLSGVGMYLFAKNFWGKLGGIVAALLYVYAPYHALNIYVRGDVAEFWAYAFIPFAFWGIYSAYRTCNEQDLLLRQTQKKPQRLALVRSSWLWIVVAAISYAGIILSHNLTAMMITPFLVIFTLILIIQGKFSRQYPLLIVFVLAALLSAFYWLPVPFEMGYTNVLSQIGGGADYKDHFVCMQQLWESPWGYGGSTHDCFDGFSLRIGKLHLILSLCALISVFIFWKVQRRIVPIILFAFLSSALALFLLLPQSQSVWNAISPMAFFQYPWRLLTIVIFMLSFLGGASMFVFTTLLKEKARVVVWVIAAVIIYGIIYVNEKVFVPQISIQKTSADYTSRENVSWEASKLSDEYLPKGFKEPKQFTDIPQQRVAKQKGVNVLSVTQNSQGIRAEITATKQTRLLLHYAYFPALHVFIDKQEVGFTYSEKGIYLTVLKGKHLVEARFVQTPIEIVGNMISLTGVLLVIIGIISTRRKRKHAKKSK